MKNEAENTLKVIHLLEKRSNIISDQNTKIKISLDRGDFKKLKIEDGDLEKIFTTLEKSKQIKITSNILFDFNKSYKQLYASVRKKLFGNKVNISLSSYNNARLLIAVGKEFKKLKKEGEIVIIINDLKKLEGYKNKINQIDDTIVHQIFFKNNREILLDNKIKLSKPNLGSENDNFFDIIYANSNKKLNILDIEAKIGKLNKRPINILTDLGFTGEIKKLFFPSVSARAIMFINPITKNYLKNNNLKQLKFGKK
jgi:hypothetical protein